MNRNEIMDELKKNQVQLIAVSKLQSAEKVRELFACGQRIFAENYVQEAKTKMDLLKDLNEIEWHFIGHLQKNKVKSVVGRFALIHSVDSLELLKKINQLSENLKIVQNVLVELNLGDESTKLGLSEKSLEDLMRASQELQHVRICGLMTMPPLGKDPEKSRPYFAKLRQLALRYGLKELSMGTSSDYQVATEEGATMVRLGTVLFGERPQKNK